MSVAKKSKPKSAEAPSARQARIPTRDAAAAAIPEAPETLDFGPLETLVGYRLRKAYSRLFQTFTEMFRELNLAPGQYSILLLIGLNPGVNQMVVAEAAELDRSTIVPIIRKFVKHGWVRRTRRQSDRRAYSLRLTPIGESILKAAQPVISAHEEQLFSELTRAERKILAELLLKIITAEPTLSDSKSVKARKSATRRPG